MATTRAVGAAAHDPAFQREVARSQDKARLIRNLGIAGITLLTATTIRGLYRLSRRVQRNRRIRAITALT